LESVRKCWKVSESVGRCQKVSGVRKCRVHNKYRDREIPWGQVRNSSMKIEGKIRAKCIATFVSVKKGAKCIATFARVKGANILMNTQTYIQRRK
jgi:hypothetical protein